MLKSVERMKWRRRWSMVYEVVVFMKVGGID